VCSFELSHNSRALAFKFLGLVRNLWPQQGQWKSFHSKNISHSLHLFCPLR
jgi:hypothetical protein